MGIGIVPLMGFTVSSGWFWLWAVVETWNSGFTGLSLGIVFVATFSLWVLAGLSLWAVPALQLR